MIRKENFRRSAGSRPAVASSERIHRETGEIPVRSRHCIRELWGRMPLGAPLSGIRTESGARPGKAPQGVELKSGELLATDTGVILTEDEKQLFLRGDLRIFRGILRQEASISCGSREFC